MRTPRLSVNGREWTFNQVCQVYKWLYERDFNEKIPERWKDIPERVIFVLKENSKKSWFRLIATVPMYHPIRVRRCSVIDCQATEIHSDGMCKYHTERMRLYGNLAFNMNGWYIGK